MPSSLEARVASLVEQREWEQVLEALADAGAPERCDPAALEVWAEANWWLGRVERCIEARRRLFDARESSGDRVGAARVALLLSEDFRRQGRSAIAEGWRRRAAALLDGQPECAEHGYLRLYQGERARRLGELDRAREALDDAAAIAARLGHVELAADVAQEIGRVMIFGGAPHDGLAAMDDAMLTASEGRLGPYTTGKIYCSIMSACEEVGDVARATQWRQATEAWTRAQRVDVFPGMCRAHHADLLAHLGRWDEALAEATRACDELREVGWVVAGAYDTIGTIRRRRGDLDGAAEAYRDAERYGVSPEAGCSLLLLAHGDVDGAMRRISRALLGASPAVRRVRLLPAQVEIAVAAGGLQVADAAAVELEEIATAFGTLQFRGLAALARSRVSVARLEWDTAFEQLDAALRLWQDLESPYGIATARLLMARACRALGDDDACATSTEIAAALLEGLGADPALVVVDDGLSARPAPYDGPLTARELDVLRLVATGATNKEIAAQLHVSQKTVARHLANIFAKVDVPTRAAATAYAYDHRLVGR